MKYEGAVVVDVLLESTTMTEQYCRENVLIQLASKLNERRLIAGNASIMIMQGNASAHKPEAAKQILSENRITAHSHRGYSQDVAPCYFQIAS